MTTFKYTINYSLEIVKKITLILHAVQLCVAAVNLKVFFYHKCMCQ